MTGLTSPLDIVDSIQTASRLMNARKESEKLAVSAGRAAIPPTFEEVLMERGMNLRGPETAIMQAMDAGFEREDDRRNGRTRSAFDFVASAQVSSAVASLYSQNSKMKLDLTAKEPFSPANAVSGSRPDFNAIIRSAIAENFGDSTEEKRVVGAMLESAFPSASPYDSYFTSDDSSPAASLLEITRTIPPELARTLGYNRFPRNADRNPLEHADHLDGKRL